MAKGKEITWLIHIIHLCQLPGQMAAVLESGLLKHLFCLWSDPSTALRLTYWLEHTLGYGMPAQYSHHRGAICIWYSVVL